MFSKLFRRPAPTPILEAAAPVETFDLFAKPGSRFAIPDWSRVEESLAERLAQEDPNALWAKVSLCCGIIGDRPNAVHLTNKSE